MRTRLRIILLAIIGLGSVIGSLTYVQHLGEPRRGEAPTTLKTVVPVPAGAPRQAALIYLQAAAMSAAEGEDVPASVDRALRRAAWGDQLPSRAQFDDTLAAAARECGANTGERWLRDVEYFGSLHSALRHAKPDSTPPHARDPFRLASAFAGGSIPNGGGLFVLAVEPPGCESGDLRWGITYGRGLFNAASPDPVVQAALKRTRVLARNARAIAQGDLSVLASLLEHEDRWVRREALQALVRSGRAEAVGLVRTRLHDADPEIRYFAALGLAALGDRSAEPHLRAYLTNDYDFLEYGMPHYRAVLALGGLGYADMRGELELMAAWDSPDLFPAEAREVLRTLAPTPG